MTNEVFLNINYLNINSLLSRLDQLRHIARLTNAAVIGTSELKLDDSVLTLKIQIDKSDLLHYNRNRHVGGVGCYIRTGLSSNVKSYHISLKIWKISENFTF